MNKFPEIQHIDQLKAGIKGKEEIHIKEEDGFLIASYMISDKNTFDTPEAVECRGITFNKDGTIVSRTLHKFFNVDQCEATRADKIDWSMVERVMDKRDGSMVHPVLDNDKVRMKTKKTFDSLPAQKAQEFIEENVKYKNFCYDLLSMDQTPVFEITTPKCRIVLPYEEDEVVLLHIRNNVTGEYVPKWQLEDIANYYDVSLVDGGLPYGVKSPYQLMDYVQDLEGVEGFVLQFLNGDMVKLKTPWYMEMHDAISYNRERDIAKMVLNETIDDHKSYLRELGYSLDRVEEIESTIVNDLIAIEYEVNRVIKEYGHLNQKDFAVKFKDSHKLFSLLMKAFNGKEPDYKEYYRKNFLDEFSLETV